MTATKKARRRPRDKEYIHTRYTRDIHTTNLLDVLRCILNGTTSSSSSCSSLPFALDASAAAGDGGGDIIAPRLGLVAVLGRFRRRRSARRRCAVVEEASSSPLDEDDEREGDRIGRRRRRKRRARRVVRTPALLGPVKEAQQIKSHCVSPQPRA